VKMKAKMKELSVTLEDVYKGKLVKIEHTRKRLCKECKGKGGSNVKTCTTCKGKCFVIRTI